MKNIQYEARIKAINLHSLDRLGLRGDLTEVFNCYRGYNRGNLSKILRINNQDRTRNNGFKREKCRFRKEMGRNWCSNRIAHEWNGVSNHIVSAERMGSFKRRLDKFMDKNDR